MSISGKQAGVLKGMLSAMFVAVSGLSLAAFGPWTNHYSAVSQSEAVILALRWDLAVIVPLVLSVGFLARHRFFTPEDIDGGGLTTGTGKAAILKAILQNTLEQTVIVIAAHLMWAAYLPGTYFMVIPVAVVMYVTGRIAFIVGYRHGAPARAFGFALTFYPSVLMLAFLLFHVSVRAFTA